MIKQKPVAFISTNRVSNDRTLAYGKVGSIHDETLYSHIELFTADQLKAEREKAILECIKLARAYSADTESSIFMRDEMFKLLSTLLNE